VCGHGAGVGGCGRGVCSHLSCQRRFRTVTSGPGPGPNRTVVKSAVRVVTKPEPLTQVRFYGKLSTRPNWAGCQPVPLWVHL